MERMTVYLYVCMGVSCVCAECAGGRSLWVHFFLYADGFLRSCCFLEYVSCVNKALLQGSRIGFHHRVPTSQHHMRPVTLHRARHRRQAAAAFMLLGKTSSSATLRT